MEPGPTFIESDFEAGFKADWTQKIEKRLGMGWNKVGHTPTSRGRTKALPETSSRKCWRRFLKGLTTTGNQSQLHFTSLRHNLIQFSSRLWKFEINDFSKNKSKVGLKTDFNGMQWGFSRFRELGRRSSPVSQQTGVVQKEKANIFQQNIVHKLITFLIRVFCVVRSSTNVCEPFNPSKYLRNRVSEMKTCFFQNKNESQA